MSIQISTQESHARLDAFLASRLKELSRSRIQDLIRAQHILVNNKPAKPRDSLKPGDAITIVIPEAVPDIASPQDIPLDILFEDQHLLVLHKQHGIVVHPAPGNPDGTLVNALLHHCKGQLSGIGGVERPGIVHRLDKDTSGCLVVAKTDTAHQALASQFAERSTMEKIYLAVTNGIPNPPSQTIFTHIGRHPVNRQKMAVLNPPGGKPSITDYQTISTHQDNKTALLLCLLHTGRTHQIRVHLHHIGTPILGDPIYGKNHPYPASRLLLHAWQLSFLHPISNKKMHLTAPPPPEFAPWLNS